MKKSIFKRVIVILLIVCTVLGNCVTVFADESSANDRVSTFISLAAGNSMESSLENIELTQDQLRFLGVFMSNFYIPFSTEFGDAGTDTLENTMESMVNALSQNLSFSEAYANMFAEYLISLSKSSTRELVFAASEEAGFKGHTVVPSTYKPQPNYYNFLATMLGHGRKICNSMSTKGWLNSSSSDYKTLNYGYWGYKDGDDFTPVFDFYLDPEKGRTASQVAFSKCLESVDIKQGYGYNVFDLTTNDFKGGNNDISSNLDDGQNWKMTILGMTMKVDCFGNILMCGYQHQIIAVPGCLNPYVWKTVNSDGTDSTEIAIGQAYNIINVPSMSAADGSSGNTMYNSVSIYSGSEESVEDTTYTTDSIKEEILWNSKTTFGKGINTALKYKESPINSAGTLIEYKVFNKKYKKEYVAIQDYLSMCEDSLQYILGYADNISGSNPWVVSFSKKGVTVSAPIYAWKGLNTNKLKTNYNYKDKDAHDKLEKKITILSSSFSIMNMLGEADTGRPYSEEDIKFIKNRDEIVSSIDLAKKNVSSLTIGSSVSQETSVTTGESSINLKTMTANINLTGFPTEMRLYRGTTDTALDGQYFGNRQYLSSFLQAVKYNIETYPHDGSITLSGWASAKGDTYEAKSSGSWGDDPVNAPINLITYSNLIPLLDCLYVVDSLGAYQGGENYDYNLLNVLNYVNSDGTTINNKTVNGVNVSFSYGSDNTFSAGYTNAVNGEMSNSLDVSVSTVSSLYTTYCCSSLYDSSDDAKAKTIGRLGFRMAVEQLPEIPNEAVSLSEEVKEDIVITSIRDWLYYLLHPTEGLSYVKELVTNKTNAFLLGWHNDMVGTNNVGQTVGTTKYRSNIGYVTTPDLSEIQWTSSLIDFYYQCIPFLIIIMLVIMLFAYITGILPIQRSLFGVLIFSLFLFLPVNLINGVVGISNQVSESIYGEKFTYWALIQQESYASAIDNAAMQSSYSNYLAALYQINNQVYDNQGGESIVLKWQAPKKMTSLMLESDDVYNSLSSGGQAMLKAYFSSNMTGESFLDSESVYMYRSYLDVSNYSRYLYRGIDSGIRNANINLTNNVTGNFYSDLQASIQNLGTNYTKDRVNGYVNTNDGGTSVSSGYKIQVPLSSGIVNDALSQLGTMSTLSLNDRVGLNTDLFNFSIPAFNSNSKNISEYLKEAVDSEPQERQDQLNIDMSGYTDTDYIGLAAYSLYSESVFYYFSWNLYDLGLEPSSQTNSGYKDLLLGQDNAGFFYNVNGNGELKDFMDMKSLFTYIVPYLKQCNDIVLEWDETYGLFTYEGVPTEEGHWNDDTIRNNSELKQKYWHNLNVARLYSLYTPWVDIMYDCGYAKGETIKAMGEKYYVENPLDPASYPAERPMIFSESEMHDYGLGEGDLTKVERLILKCNQGMEERMYELLNYYNFSDVTLNTAAAINCAFEFNSTFSENGFLSENHNIYPQSFELADFSYDAFLRFILSNTTGESLNNSEDFYADVVNKSSMTTSIIMLVLDILSVYVLPAFKIFFIIALFLASILLIICTAFRVDPESKFIKKVLSGIVIPMLKFMAISIGFSYVISLFMGTGNNAVTQTKEVSIQMGDPVVVMLFMLAIDIAALVLYYKVIKGVVKTVISESKMAFSFVGGVTGGLLGMVSGAISSALHRSNDNSGVNGNSNGGVSEEGTGVTSSRAQARGSKNTEDIENYEEDDSSVRRNDTKRDTIKPDRDSEYDDLSNRTEEINRRTRSGLDKMSEKAEGFEEKAEDFSEKLEDTMD